VITRYVITRRYCSDNRSKFFNQLWNIRLLDPLECLRIKNSDIYLSNGDGLCNHCFNVFDE
jgi:hypothetical protein